MKSLNFKQEREMIILSIFENLPLVANRGFTRDKARDKNQKSTQIGKNC